MRDDPIPDVAMPGLQGAPSAVMEELRRRCSSSDEYMGMLRAGDDLGCVWWIVRALEEAASELEESVRQCDNFTEELLDLDEEWRSEGKA